MIKPQCVPERIAQPEAFEAQPGQFGSELLFKRFADPIVFTNMKS